MTNSQKNKILSVIVAGGYGVAGVAEALQDVSVETSTTESGDTTVEVGPNQAVKQLASSFIGGVVGFLAGGPPGAVAGAVAGYVLPVALDKDK